MDLLKRLVTKIALGHHLDDIVGTLNMFFQGKLKAMPPKLLSDDGKILLFDPCLIVGRKIYYDMGSIDFRIRVICVGLENLERSRFKSVASWEKEFPGRVENIFRSIQNISLSQLEILTCIILLI